MRYERRRHPNKILVELTNKELKDYRRQKLKERVDEWARFCRREDFINIGYPSATSEGRIMEQHRGGSEIARSAHLDIDLMSRIEEVNNIVRLLSREQRRALKAGYMEGDEPPWIKAGFTDKNKYYALKNSAMEHLEIKLSLGCTDIP